MKMKAHNKSYIYKFRNEDEVSIQAIPTDGYRLISTTPDLVPPPPVPHQSNYWEFGKQWVVNEDFENPGYERLQELHQKYVLQITTRQQVIAISYVINQGVVDDVPEEEVERIRNQGVFYNEEDIKVEYILDKCADDEEYLDFIDAIIGINMPTESGVISVMKSFQSMILDNGNLVPLLEWKSRKESKSGVVMSLYAEGIMACAQLNGIISLKEYVSLAGDPRYINESSEYPISMCHIIAINRASNKSSNATQEIEMEKDNNK